MKKSDYDELIRFAKDPYQGFIHEHKSECDLTYDEAKKALVELATSNNYIVFEKSPGEIDGLFFYEVKKLFETNKRPYVIYCDEDVIKSGQDGKSTSYRCNPFFKPDFSPDTLESFFYMGGLLLVKEDFIKICHMDDVLANLCDGCAGLTDTLMCELRDGMLGMLKNPQNDREQFYHIDIVGYHALNDCKDGAVYEYNEPLSFEEKINAKISCVILSKDHPKLLKACIDSLQKYADCTLEYIVVDNGSTSSNRAEYEAYLEAVGGKYYYRPSDFVYSALCNIGASYATGDVLLFMNDDITLPEKVEGFPSMLLRHAVMKRSGAVGVKLLYPESAPVYPGCIQHIGMTMLNSGPSHKLCSYDDSYSYEYGRNRRTWNVMGVTGACLMVERSKFLEVNGFDESVKVAYTDTDLCLDIAKKGYYNLVINDIYLYHHESVTRGSDIDDARKLKRLNEERSVLYRKHPYILERDVFYNRNLAKHRLDYAADYVLPWERDFVSEEVSDKIRTKEEPCLCGNIDSRELVFDELGGVRYLKITGWVMRPSTKAIKRNHLADEPAICVHDKNGETHVFSCQRMYRADLGEVFQKERNILMSGFVCHLPLDVADGAQDVGVALIDRNIIGERRCLYKFAAKTTV